MKRIGIIMAAVLMAVLVVADSSQACGILKAIVRAPGAVVRGAGRAVKGAARGAARVAAPRARRGGNCG